MLARKYRLNLATANWRYNRSDHQISSPNFKIVAKKNNSSISRFGFLVTGKVGKANKRNQLRRWLAESVGEKLQSFPVGFDFVFIAYPKEGVSHEEIRSSLNQVLPKISIFR